MVISGGPTVTSITVLTPSRTVALVLAAKRKVGFHRFHLGCSAVRKCHKPSVPRWDGRKSVVIAALGLSGCGSRLFRSRYNKTGRIGIQRYVLSAHQEVRRRRIIMQLGM